MTYTVSPGQFGADVTKDGELFATTFCGHPDGYHVREPHVSCVAAMTRRAEEIVFALNMMQRLGVLARLDKRFVAASPGEYALLEIFQEIRTQGAP